MNILDQLHSGYILDSVQIELSKLVSQPVELQRSLRELSYFDIQYAFSPQSFSDPTVVILENLISRGLPTRPSIYIEDLFGELFGTSKKRINEKIGDIHYQSTEQLREHIDLIYNSLFVVDPRITVDAVRFQGDSEAESNFFREILPQFHPSLIQIIEPQRSIQSIIQKQQFVKQRVDFALEFPETGKWSKGMVIEIDGRQHQEVLSQKSLDKRRDEALKQAGWYTTRITTKELASLPRAKIQPIENFLSHPYFCRIKENFDHPIWTKEFGLDALQIALSPFAIARVQKSILFLISSGVLRFDQESWDIAILERDVPCGLIAVRDIEQAFQNIFSLEGEGRKLPRIDLHIFNTAEFAPCELNRGIETVRIERFVPDVDYDAIIDISMLQRTRINYPPIDGLEQLSNYLKISTSRTIFKERRFRSATPIKYHTSDVDKEENSASLIYFLQNIFRKQNFREGQIKILKRTLALESVIALLPTGAGKSLTYQLSVLLQPGIAIIIDPLKSLMRDQDENLKAAGIDSTVFINSSLSPQDRRRASEGMSQGLYQFIFISPERLQIGEFRKHLQSMKNIYFTYCIVDEAHCVSEWGHDFRTSYLRLGSNARKYCKTKADELPIIALTGTASFDVLSDVRRELDIHANAVIAPKKYGREELTFRVREVEEPSIPITATEKQIKELVAEKKTAALFQLLEEIPHHPWTIAHQYESLPQFFSDKNSGIIFCPHVGWKFGVKEVSSALKNRFPAIEPLVGIYAGKLENDYADKVDLVEVQHDFKSDKLKLLVATKAFGMGIDKPNIRFTIHYNMPQSIESFYQEAGRAGRDKDAAHCYILYSPTKINNNTVDQDNMLFFYNTSFPGIEKEKKMLWELLHRQTTESGEHRPGFESILKEMEFGQRERVRVSFANNVITEIASYLRRFDHRWQESMIRSATSSSYNPNEFCRKLERQFRIKTGRSNKLDEDQINELTRAFSKIRDQQNTFKAIYRLSIIGLIEEYEIDYKEKVITVTLSKKKEEEYIESLTKYVGRYVSAEKKHRVPHDIREAKGNTIIQKCAGYLIEFVYDKIASKRLQAIHVMEQSIIEGLHGGNLEERINTYFDSRYTPKLRGYLYNYSIEVVWEFFGKTEGDPDAVNHLRGACDRLLVENPNNAAFLLLRAFTKFLMPHGDNADALDDYRKGWRKFRDLKGWSRKEYLKHVSEYYARIMKFDTSTNIFLDNEILYEHTTWLKSFNHKFIEGIQHESTE